MRASLLLLLAMQATGVIVTILAATSATGQGSPAKLAPMLYSSSGYDHTLHSRLLGAHNRERAALQLQPLRWDPALAASAASYGPTLAAMGALRHSPRADRAGQSENLWMGKRAAYTPEKMVGHWIDERREFRPGVFPHVASTGDWADVGHYTTMIWPTTTAVGCAVHRSPNWDFLICRYSPRSNIDGKRVG
jgi:hypothetical protein